MPNSEKSTRPVLNWNVSKGILIRGNDDDGIYANELHEAIRYCEQASNLLASDSQCGERPNTVVGVIGERGTGKTSLLYSLEENMPDDVLSLGIADLTDFQDKINALELFLAALYGHYEKLLERRPASITSERQTKINSSFKKLTKTLSSVRENTDVYHNENPSPEVLAHLHDLSTFREMIASLCREYLELYNNASDDNDKSSLAILFDDVDLVTNTYVYVLLQDIRKYLSGNIIVVLSFRESQLLDSIESQCIKEDRILLDSNFENIEEIRSKATDLYEKIVPSDRRVRLFDQNQILDLEITDIISAISDSDDDAIDAFLSKISGDSDSCKGVNVREWIEKTIYRKTLLRILPVRKKELTPYIWPKNIRELLPLLELLIEKMKDINYENQSNYTSNLYNLSVFQSYFLDRISQNMDSTLWDDLHVWMRSDPDLKNYTAYSQIANLLAIAIESIGITNNQRENVAQESGRRGRSVRAATRQNEVLGISTTTPNNVTIGDVSRILDELASAAYYSDMHKYFVYAYKMLYSMELLKSILIQLASANAANRIDALSVESSSNALENYLSLINTCLVSPENQMTQLSLELNWRRIKDDLETKNIGSVDAALEFAKNVMYWTCSSEFPVNSRTFRTSRTFLPPQEASIFNPSASINNAYNRALFDSEAFDDDEDSEEIFQVSDQGESLYAFSVINFLGKKPYVEKAIDQIINGSRLGEYLFYSMFDLDIFNELLLSNKKGSENLVSYQMLKLNRAFRFAATSDGMSYEAVDANKVKIKKEHILYSLLSVPFISSGQYALFPSEEDSEIVSIDSIKGALPISLEDIDFIYRASISPRNEVSSEASSNLISTVDEMSKYDIITYIQSLFNNIDSLSNRQRLNGILLHLGQPNRRMRLQDKSALREIIEENPAAAISAYEAMFNG